MPTASCKSWRTTRCGASAELIGVERRDRVEARRKAAAQAPGATGTSQTNRVFAFPCRPERVRSPGSDRVASGRIRARTRRPHVMEEGFDLDIRRPPLGDVLPETLDGHAARWFRRADERQ